MIRVGIAAPHFDCSAVVAGRLVRLNWDQMHNNRTLILLFDTIDGMTPFADDLIAVGTTLGRPGRPRANVAVVLHNDLSETLAWANRPRSEGGPGALAFPLIVDPDGLIASDYGLLGAGRPLRGHFVIDPSGTIREMAIRDFPLGPGTDELIRSVQASGFPPDKGLWN